MQSSNQRCNALQSTVGIFLQLVNAPERIINLGAHSGWTMSSKTNDRGLRALEKEFLALIKAHWKKRPNEFQWVYDNIEWPEESSTPTLDNPNRFISATAATFLPLQHGVTRANLACWAELWERSINNLKADQTKIYFPKLDHLIMQHNEFRKRVAWHIRSLLIEYCEGLDTPEFRRRLGLPLASQIQIPVTKTRQYPAWLMSHKQSTVEGTIDVLDGLMAQVGGKPEDVAEHVILVNGDLGSIERAQSAQFTRRLETTPETNFSAHVFIPGFFHLKMAAVDALFRTYIKPEKSRAGPSTPYQHAGILRPKESTKFQSNPTFRQMHDLVHHDIAARLIDCLEIVVRREYQCISLDVFIKSELTWEIFERLSEAIVEWMLPRPRTLSETSDPEDVVFRNSQLWFRDAFLYIELSHALNYGDIGRAEQVLLPWTELFAAAGKHKYSAQLLRFLLTLQHNHPPPLQHAIRMHWLCNPTGRKDGFCGADWLMELNNLFTKVIYGGSTSNKGLELIMQRSPLIDIFRQTHTIIENNFCISPRTMRHAKPNLKPVIQRLVTHIKRHRPHEKIWRRQGETEYAVPDQLKLGHNLQMNRLETIFLRPWSLNSTEDGAETDEGFAIEVADRRDNLDA